MTATVKFNKVKKGEYRFLGTDSWTGKEMSGTISHQPYDKKLSQAWEIRFDGSDLAEEMMPTLKDCKDWLTQ